MKLKFKIQPYQSNAVDAVMGCFTGQPKATQCAIALIRGASRRAVEKRGAWLLFLPPYSPDLNPIERAFSKFKAHMKRLKPEAPQTENN